MTHEEKYDWFERHRNGELSEAEQARFARVLADDAEFLTEFRTFSALAGSLAKPPRSPLRGELEAARDRFRFAEDRRKAVWRRFALAAVALALLGLLWLFAQKPLPEKAPAPQTPETNAPAEAPYPVLETPKPKVPVAALPKMPSKPTTAEKPRQFAALAQSFYEKSPTKTLLRTEGNVENAPLAAASAYLANGKPDEALAALQAADADDEEALYLRGHAHFQSKNYTAAAMEFGQLATGGGFRQSAQWFLLLSLAAQGPTKLAAVRQLADNISTEPGHPFSEPSQRLRAELGRGF